MAEQVREYKRVFEMFDEEGNGAVRMDQLERLMSLLDINPTKSELASMAKDVDRDSEAGPGSPGGDLQCVRVCHPHSHRLLLASLQRKGSSALTTSWPWEKVQNQEGELRVASPFFDKEGKGHTDWDTLK